MLKKTIDDVEVRGRRVLMRVDFNAPVEDSRILDDRRLRDALDSIRSVVLRGGKLVLMSHLGRPLREGFDAEWTLAPCARRLSDLLARPVQMAPDCVGPAVQGMAERLLEGQVLLLENLRFHPGESLNQRDFAGQLAAMGDVYCNEAFAVSHRAHASLLALPQAMADRSRVAGLRLCRELRCLQAVAQRADRPFVLVLGGDRLPDRIGALLNLMGRLDAVLVGGTPAYTFMAAEGRPVGQSPIEPQQLQAARVILEAAGRHRAHILLPRDHVCGHDPTAAAAAHVIRDTVPDDCVGLDIGPRTVVAYSDILRHARTVFWVGPLGAWERRPFDVGTKMIALAVAHTTLINHAHTVVAGGATVQALVRFGLAESVTHVSHGGDATLALLEGRPFETLDLLESLPQPASTPPPAPPARTAPARSVEV